MNSVCVLGGCSFFLLWKLQPHSLSLCSPQLGKKGIPSFSLLGKVGKHVKNGSQVPTPALGLVKTDIPALTNTLLLNDGKLIPKEEQIIQPVALSRISGQLTVGEGTESTSQWRQVAQGQTKWANYSSILLLHPMDSPDNSRHILSEIWRLPIVIPVLFSN